MRRSQSSHSLVWDLIRKVKSSVDNQLLLLLEEDETRSLPVSSHLLPKNSSERNSHLPTITMEDSISPIQKNNPPRRRTTTRSSTADSPRKRRNHQQQQKVVMEQSSLVEDDLHHRLEPIVHALEDLDAQTLLELEKVNTDDDDGARLGDDGIKVRPIHSLISPPISPKQQDDCIRYLHVVTVAHQYSIGIFIFPPNASIPFHDHPGMSVLSRVLYGDLTLQSFDILQNPRHHYYGNTKGDNIHANADHGPKRPKRQQQNQQAPISCLFHILSPLLQALLPLTKGFHHHYPSRPNHTTTTTPPSQTRKWILSKQNQTKTIVAPNVAMLFPHQGNVHEFVAGEQGAAVLDVLIPPYDDDGDRDCTFYSPKPIQTTTRDDDDDVSRLCWLVPIPPPRKYQCETGTYNSLGEMYDDGDDDESED